MTTTFKTNNLIILNFQKLIDLITIDNILHPNIANQFRIAKLKNIIKIITKYPKLITNYEQLKGIEGIGKHSLKRIDEILKTGKLSELNSLEAKKLRQFATKTKQKTKLIDELIKIIGIGRNMAYQLMSKYNFNSIKELKQMEKNNQIVLNDKIKLGLKYLGKFKGDIPRHEIDLIYDHLQHLTHSYDPNMFVTICGSYRRELSTSSDVDVLLSDMNLITKNDMETNRNKLKKYVEYLRKEGFIVDDITDKNYVSKYMGFCVFLKSNIRRIDIRLIPMESYFPALLYFTGSYELNKKMRSQAKKLGYKLNEYGLFRLDNDEFIVQLSEQEIFEKLNMPYLIPKMR